MPAPDDNDRDDALLRRLYDEPDADSAAPRHRAVVAGMPGDDGELAREVESFKRVRGAIADYARATEVEPPSRGMDELLAAARQRAPARAAAAAPEAPGVWARLRAWFAPIAAHPALASAAMVVLVAGVAGVLYLKGKTRVAEDEVGRAQADHFAAGTPPTEAETTPTLDRDPGIVAGLDDGDQGSATADNQANAQPETMTQKPPTKNNKPGKTRPAGGGTKTAEGQGGGGTADTGTAVATENGVAVGPGKVITDDGRFEDVPVTEPAVPKATAPPPVGTTGTSTSTAPTRDVGGAEDVLLAGGDEVEESMPEGGKDKRPPTAAEKMDQLTRQARTAAKSGDCGVVKSIGGRVKKASASYYKQTFSADATIKKCL